MKTLTDKEKYENLKAYIGGKISEMCDCDECALSDHQAEHLFAIEDYIDDLER